jgi:hypothetical protein
MMEMTSLKVGDYLWRPAGERARKLIEQWIEADSDHSGRVTADFFCKSTEGHECYAVEDACGLVIFYVKLNLPPGSRVLRINMLFRPYDRLKRRKWTADALVAGFDWLKQASEGVGLAEIVFKSSKPELVTFAIRRLGFQRRDDEFTYAIPSRAGVAA